MDRLNWEEYVCLLALSVSSRSEDPFTQVGAALLDVSGAVLGTGMNGLRRGMKIPDWMTKEENRSLKSDYMIHAESNLFKNKKGGDNWLLGLTITPCEGCAKLIAANDIQKVVYIKPYEKGGEGFKKIFDFYNIEYTQLSDHSVNRIKRIMMEKFSKI